MKKKVGNFLSLGQRHPVLGKNFKMFEFFGFDPITLRIGPFGVDDEKFSFCKNFCPGLPGHA